MKHDTFTLELTFKVLFKGVEVYTHDGVFSAYAVKWQGSWTRRFYGQFVINHQGEAWDGDEDGNDEEKRVAQLLKDGSDWWRKRKFGEMQQIPSD